MERTMPLPRAGYARFMTSLQLPRNRAEHLIFLRRLVELWDKTDGKTWEFSRDRDHLNAPLIYGFTAQAATLSKAVLTLYAAGQDFAALPLIRTTMECAVTAAWLSVADFQTRRVMYAGAEERRKLLHEIAEHTVVDVSDALAETLGMLDTLLEGGTLVEPSYWERFHQLVGGASLYASYRALCAYGHATPALAEAYMRQTEPTPSNPNGLQFASFPEENSPDSWLGSQSCMLLLAQISADSILSKRMHKTQLNTFADRLGVQREIVFIPPKVKGINRGSSSADSVV